MTSEVHNIDCLEYMRTLPDNYFQLAIADPPYGIDRGGQTETFTKNPKHKRKFFEQKDWDKQSPSAEFFEELMRVCENVVIWGANYYPEFLTRSMGWIVWDKGQHGLSMSDGELAYTSFERALRVVTINRGELAREGTIHPTQKPVSLYAWILAHYAKDGDRIFDPMMGSQSSRIAAYKLGFDYVGCELDKEYFDKGCERFDRECHGIYVNADGSKVQQQTLF